MSSTLAPQGMIPIYHPSGQVRASQYESPFSAAYATNLYQGTPVSVDTNGNIVIATNGTPYLGAFAGCAYTDTNGRRQYSKMWPASLTATEIVAFVWDDPLIEYIMQVNGSAAQTAIGDNANFSAASGYAVGDGNSPIQLSTCALDASLVGAGNVGMFRVLDRSRTVGNDWGDTYTWVRGTVSRHRYVATINAI